MVFVILQLETSVSCTLMKLNVIQTLSRKSSENELTKAVDGTVEQTINKSNGQSGTN